MKLHFNFSKLIFDPTSRIPALLAIIMFGSILLGEIKLISYQWEAIVVLGSMVFLGIIDYCLIRLVKIIFKIDINK